MINKTQERLLKELHQYREANPSIGLKWPTIQPVDSSKPFGAVTQQVQVASCSGGT